MTEVSLKVNHEMILPEELKYTKFQTNSVMNQIEEQTLEKAYVPYTATSGDSSTLVFNLPSISGGAMVRELDLEVPLEWSITYKNYFPAALKLDATATGDGTTAIPINTNVYVCQSGSSPRPFLSEINCLDMFPLSKLFHNREYTLNNSSTIVKEEFDPEQIDCMVAQLNLMRVCDKQLCPFADANSHFQVLAHSCGGVLSPDMAILDDASSTLVSGSTTIPASASLVNMAFYLEYIKRVFGLETKKCSGWQKSWFSDRNTARNVQNQTVSFTFPTPTAGNPYTANTVPDYGSNLVPVRTSSDAVTGDVKAVAIVGTGNSITVKFTVIVREKLISQFWDNDYTFNKFSWNKLIPVSSLNIKLNVNTTYKDTALLKIGDDTRMFNTYTITKPSIGSPSNCRLWVRQCKVPLSLYPRQSYKLLYYAQEKPQASKDMQVEGSKFTATMQYSNLSQVPEYLLIYLPINKSVYIDKVYKTVDPDKRTPPVALPAGWLPIDRTSDQDTDNLNANVNEYQLPSVFNLPITKLELTFNQDTNLASYSLDTYQLQQFTMQNLQDDDRLMDLIVGKSSEAVGEYGGTNIQNLIAISGANNTAANLLNLGVRQLESQVGPSGAYKYKYNGVSNSSYYILKLGSQIRLPEGYAASQIVNYNLTVKCECDLTVDGSGRFTNKALHDVRDYRNDAQALVNFLTQLSGTSISFAKLQVIHFNKRILSLSGDAMQNVYIHNVQITSGEYTDLITKFEANFSTASKDEVFSSDMMIGGSFMSKLKDKALSIIPVVNQAAKLGRIGVDVAKKFMPENKVVDAVDKGLSFIGRGGMMDPREVEAGAMRVEAGSMRVDAGRRGRPSGSSKAAVDWKQYARGL